MAATAKFSEISQRDYNLVTLALSGDQKAYSQIVQIYKPLIFYSLFKIIRNRRDSDELTFEVFEKAFSKLHQYKPEYAFCTWLFRISANCAFDFIRKKQKNKFLSLDDPDDYALTINSGCLISNIPTPEQVVINEQIGVMMRVVVRNLKPEYSKLVELHYFKQYSFNEINQQLEIPMGTIKNRMFRSREILHNKLKTYNNAM